MDDIFIWQGLWTTTGLIKKMLIMVENLQFKMYFVSFFNINIIKMLTGPPLIVSMR